MKKALPILLFQSLFATFCFAQNLISKVPADASLVLKYSEAKLMQKMPATKFDTYTSLKNKLFEALHLDPAISLYDIGIDLQQDAYQYLQSTDTTHSFVTLAYISNSAKFNQFIQKKNVKNMPLETIGGFELLPISSSAFLGWNGKMAALVVLNYTDYSYYQQTYTVDSTKMFADVGKNTPYTDSTVALVPAPDTAMKAVDTSATTIAVDSAVAFTEDSATTAAREKFEAEKQIKDSLIQKGLAENILLGVYDSSVTSIATNGLYNKLVDSSADISAWIGSINIFNDLYNYHQHDTYYVAPYSNLNRWLGYSQAVNIYFEGGSMRIVQNLSSGTDSLTQLFKNVFNSKQDASFINYIHPSDLGYFSVSINTEAMLNYYYPLMKRIFSDVPYTKGYADAINAYIDILQIVIDEKAIADMIPGNAIFILHSMKQKQVKYISYEYDKNFNSTPTEKTKTEMSPDFSFIFETRNEKIFNELADLPVKLGKITHDFNYTKTGDYYTLVLGKDNLIDNLYFKVKDGKCIITTSLQDVSDATMQASAIDPAIKQSILNSNYSAMFNINSLVKNLSGEVTDKKNKKMVNYLQDNVKDMTLQSVVKDDFIQTTATLNTAGEHANSLQYFFDIIEKLLDMDTK